MRTAEGIEYVVALVVPPKKELVVHHLVGEDIKTLCWVGEHVLNLFCVSDQAQSDLTSIATVELSLLVCLRASCNATNVIKSSSAQPVVDHGQFVLVETIHQTHRKNACRELK